MTQFRLVEPHDWDETLAGVRAQIGEPLNIHRLLANYPEWLLAWMSFRNHVVHGTTLSARQFELIVLRVATLAEAPYEWEHHVVTGKEAGLTDAEIERVRSGPDAAGWNAADAVLLNAVDDCILRRCVTEKTLEALRVEFNDKQLLDIIATVTMYFAMAVVTRTFAVPIDEHKPSFSIENVD